MQTFRQRRAARTVLATTLLALLLAQWVALAHAVLHAPALQAGALAFQADGFGHAADAAECRLVDHLLAGQAPAPPCALAVAAVHPDEPAARAAVAASTALVLAYAARAPPRT